MDFQSPITFNDDSPLHVAVRQGQVEDVREILIKQQIDVNILNSKQETPLHLACSKNNSSIVQLLVAFGADPYIKDSNSENAYDECSFDVYQSMSKLLYSHGLRLWIDGPVQADKESPLHTAVRLGRLDDIQRIIEEKVIDINDTNANHETPLHLACALGHKHIVHILITNGADMYKKDIFNNAPIHRAVSQGHIDAVDYLITVCACNPNIKGYQGRTLLHFACGTGNSKMISTLIEKCGISPMATDAVNQTPLHIAASHGQEEVVCLLVTNYNLTATIDCRSNDKLSPLHLACYCGHKSVVKILLLEYKADLNARDESGYTPFEKVVLGGHSVLLQLMITNFEQDPLSPNDDGNTPLHMACLGGQEELARLLITKYNCPVDVVNKNNHTSLHIACLVGHSPIVKMLVIEFKANLMARDRENDTPINKAALNGHENTVQVLITELGCSPQIKGFQGRSLLHQACDKGHTKLAMILITDFGLDPFSVDDSGNAPLHMACWSGHEELARLLITKYNYPIDVKNKIKETPLHLACSSGRSSIVRMLISEFKADATRRDHNSDTAVSKAAEGGHVETVQALITELGCSPNVTGYDGRSLLHEACWSGSIKLVGMLVIDFRLDILSADDSGNTPLHMACWGGHEELARLLITKYNCPIDVKNYIKETPLHKACSSGHSSIVRMLVSEFKADATVRDHNNDTVISKATDGGHVETVKALINSNLPTISHKSLRQLCQRGSVDLIDIFLSDFHLDPSSVLDNEGNQAIHIAALHGHEQVLSLLVLKYKCPIDSRNLNGQTPLHLLCSQPSTENGCALIRMCVSEFKADMTIKDNNGDQPIHAAVQADHNSTVVDLILDHGVSPNSRGFKKRSLLHYALANGHISTAKTLTEVFHLSLHCIDEDGNTPLHLSSLLGRPESLRFLLYEYHAPVYVRNKAGKTALDLATKDSTKKVIREYISSEYKRIQHEYEDLRAKSKQKYSGQQVISRVFVLGNPESGKSTLVESLKRKGIISSLFTVTEADVPPHTAGIVPSVHQSKEAGRLLYYDFAGDQEYYSSHAAILEIISSLTVGSNVYFIVTDLRKDNMTIQNEIGYWLSFIAYHGEALDSQCRLKIVIVLSHSDYLNSTDCASKIESMRQYLGTHRNQYDKIFNIVEVVSSNCCWPRSTRNIESILQQISKDTAPCSISYEASLLHGLLEKDFSNVIACKFQDLLSHIKDTNIICLPSIADLLFPVVKELHDIGLLMMIGQSGDRLEDYLLLLNLSSLTHEVHQNLFSKSAKEMFHSSIGPQYANMGILPESYLAKLLPEHITKECLVQLQYCQEFTCADVGLDSSGVSNSASEKNLLYFPALCKLDSEQSNWPTDPLLNFSIGWYAKCTGKFDYFPTRFLHVLLLRLAFTFALPIANCNITESNEISAHNRRCTMWNNGIRWLMEEGVECIFEMVNDNKGIVVITKSEGGSKEWSSILSKIIIKTLQAKAEFCSTVSLYHFLLKSNNTSSFMNEDKLFEIAEIERVIKEGKKKIVSVSGRAFLDSSHLDIFRKYTFWGR